MRLSLFVLAAATVVWSPRGSSAQGDLKTMRTAYLTFARVDSLAFLFDVDTGALRRRIADRLSDARVAIVDDQSAPSLELTITVFRPSSVRAEGSAWVAMTLTPSRRARDRRSSILWEGQSTRQEVTAFRMLPAIVASAVDRVVDELIQARKDRAR